MFGKSLQHQQNLCQHQQNLCDLWEKLFGDGENGLGKCGDGEKTRFANVTGAKFGKTGADLGAFVKNLSGN